MLTNELLVWTSCIMHKCVISTMFGWCFWFFKKTFYSNNRWSPPHCPGLSHFPLRFFIPSTLAARSVRSQWKELLEPWSKLDLFGLSLSCAQAVCAGPPSFRIHCHHPAYSAELAETQNPLPKPHHRLTDQVNLYIWFENNKC